MSLHHRYHHLAFDYLVLSLILLTCLFSFTKTSGSSDKQVQIGLITAFSYWGWGIFHHLHEGDLHWKIVIEYSTFALFGFAIIWFLLAMR